MFGESRKHFGQVCKYYTFIDAQKLSMLDAMLCKTQHINYTELYVSVLYACVCWYRGYCWSFCQPHIDQLNPKILVDSPCLFQILYCHPFPCAPATAFVAPLHSGNRSRDAIDISPIPCHWYISKSWSYSELPSLTKCSGISCRIVQLSQLTAYNSNVLGY